MEGTTKVIYTYSLTLLPHVPKLTHIHYTCDTSSLSFLYFDTYYAASRSVIPDDEQRGDEFTRTEQRF